jgi:RHS repeat-associated protein
MTYPDGRVVQNGFDAAGRMNAVTYLSWNSNSINQPYFSESNGYDPAGHPISATFGNGVAYTAGYDYRERISTLMYGGSSAPLWSKQFAWIKNSNLQSQTDLITGVQRQFNYDNLNRLTAAQDIYSTLAVPSGSNDNTGSTSTSGSGAEETPGATGASPEWTNPDDSNILPNFGEPNANWQGTGVTLNSVTAPDGTMTGATLLAAGGPGGIILGGFVPDPSIYAGETMGGSVWLRATTPTAMNVYLIGTNGGIVASTQAQLTTSWQQVQLRGLVQGTPTGLSLQIGGGSPAVIGQNVYMWNPMVEDEGDAGTSVTNFLPYSQLPTAPNWSGLSYSVAATSDSAPDGSLTTMLVTSAVTNNGTYITDSVTNPSPFSQQAVTGSVYLRVPAGSLSVTVSVVEKTGGNTSVCGQVAVTATTVWQRVSVPCTAQNTLSTLSLQVSGGSGSQFELWGAQLELASQAGPYVATAAIPVTASTNLTNILEYSQQPNGQTWFETYQFPGVANSVVAPDGSETGYQATAQGGSGWLTNDVTNPPLYDNATVTASVYLRVPSGTGSINFYLIAQNPSGWGILQQVTAQLTTTWQRFSATAQLPNSLTRLYIQIGDTETAGQVVDVWGSQMEIASHAGPYIATTALPVITGSEPTNILPNSQTFSGTNWVLFSSATTVTPNYAVAPDGTTTAALLQAATNSTDSGIKAAVPNPSLYDGETVTASIYIRVSSGTPRINLYLQNIGDQGSLVAAQSTPTLSTTWQRFDLTATLQNGLKTLYLQVGGAGSLSNGQSIQIWGAQFVIGSAPAPYTPTPSAATVYATGQPGTLVQTGLNQSYSYDSFGNILQNGSFNSSYTANNQMFGYAYDAAGNLLSDGINIMTWDAESRMSTVGGATYVYDAEGNRVEKQGSVITDTIYFGGEPIARYAGGQWTDLIYAPTGLLAEVPGTQAGSPVYRVTDHLGTNVGSLLANGTFVDPVDHTPFGQVITGNTSDPYLFTGKERDAESGLDYFGARYYGSNMGRFMSPDWADKPEAVPYSSLGDPQSLNLYSYVRNNPMRSIDADGHDLDCSGSTGGGAGCQAIIQWNTDHDVSASAWAAIGLAGSGRAQQNNANGYQTQNGAARAALTGANPDSIKANREYGGLIYVDKSGKYHYSGPVIGGDQGVNPHDAGHPDGTTVVGDYHTHGDYSIAGPNGQAIRTGDPKRDDFNSDHFSVGPHADTGGIIHDAAGNPNYRGYLGTPSGNFLIFNPVTGKESPLP